ncbi:MAG: FHA domain-containing protein, partial [Vulcanisaeta sp.]
NEVVVRDLNSTNGTYVLENGEFRRINEYRFSNEAMIRLGYYTIIKLLIVEGSVNESTGK